MFIVAVMEQTWDNDVQSKVCYLYDYWHDDEVAKDHDFSYENTKKIRIDAKFIVTQYGSLSSDQVEFHLMFKPSQKLRFDRYDDLYFYEENFAQKYNAEFPIGLYVDIPNDRGEYRRWLVCAINIGNQFVKYSVLPCNHRFTWIEDNGLKRIKRRMWGVLRLQSSYNSGVWSTNKMTIQENQDKVWLPMNSITDKIWYKGEMGHNLRVVVGGTKENPLCWQVSKVENEQPRGIQKIVLYQDFYNPKTDYYDERDGVWYADYYGSNDSTLKPVSEKNDGFSEAVTCTLSCSTNSITVGGSFKKISALFTDRMNQDKTALYSSQLSGASWSCYLLKKEADGSWSEDEDITAKGDLLTWSYADDFTFAKIKVANNKSYLNKTVRIKLTVADIVGQVELELRP